MTVIPIYHMLVVPDSVAYFQTERYRALTGKPPVENERVVFVLSKEAKKRTELDDESFYPIGVSGVITETNANGFITISTTNRVHIDEVHVNMDHSIELVMRPLFDIDDMAPDDENARLNAIKNELNDLINRFEWGKYASYYLDQWHNISEAAGALSGWMNISDKDIFLLLYHSRPYSA